MDSILPSKSKNNITTKDLVVMAVCVALMAICSWISIPVNVPFTMQMFAIFITVGLLGTKKSVLSVVTYLLLGAIGVPVFAGFHAGIGTLLGNTGGYLISYIFVALITGLIIDKFGRSYPVMLIAMLIGLAICYIFGTAWFMYVYLHNTGEVGLMTVLGWCVFPFIIPDIIKIVLAIGMSKRLIRYI